MRPLAAALVALGLATSAAAPALAQAARAEDAAFRATTLSLSAYGETTLAPDQATITLGVTTPGPTAAAAMAANRTRMAATLRSLAAQGIAERDIQTSGLNLNPQYVYAQGQPPKLTGYEASNQVTATVRDLGKLGATVDAVVAAGANQVQGIAFGLQSPRAAEDAARREAVTALQAKAELYAKATGYRIARLVNLTEGGGDGSPPRPMFRLAAAPARAESTPVAPGELKVRIDVSGVFELTR